MLVCVADEQDPAVAVFERIRQRHPHVDARLFTGGRDGIINPLVHNLAPAYDAAKYDIVWISTSRIKGLSVSQCLCTPFSCLFESRLKK